MIGTCIARRHAIPAPVVPYSAVHTPIGAPTA
jgi:hypothetical protein